MSDISGSDPEQGPVRPSGAVAGGNEGSGPGQGPGGHSGPEAINPAQVERWLLCDLLAEAGPEAPTKCAGWTTADLAAHLVVRETRPDAGPGILLPPLAGYTERLRRRTKERTSYVRLLEQLRQGPPKYSIWALPGMDKNGNAVEYFVHHEDVRRARPDWQPRPLPPAVEELLWRRLRMARFILRKVPVQVTLVRPDGKAMQVSKGGKPVRVHGPVSELVLWALGRTDVAQVRFTGDADALRLLAEAGWSL